RFANAGEGPAVIRVEVRPALRMEQLWETTVALAAEGRTFRSGLPRPLDLALFMREFEQEVRAPFAPGMVRAATAPLAWLAARRGLTRRYQAPGIRDLERARKPAPARPGQGRVNAAPPSPARPDPPREPRSPAGPPAAPPKRPARHPSRHRAAPGTARRRGRSFPPDPVPSRSGDHCRTTQPARESQTSP